MITDLSEVKIFRPKLYQHEMLEVYQVAEKVGANHGNCDQAYPECPFSVFEVFPVQVDLTFSFHVVKGSQQNMYLYINSLLDILCMFSHVRAILLS
jgi:hypothetical protein